MAEAISVSGQVSGSDKVITFETGKLAGLADGAVTAKIDGTVVLVTAAAGGARPGADFFPLTVDMEERMYAAGRIPGSFFRREGRASEDAILTCRLIDRPLRPSFPKGYRNDTHVVGTILGVDGENPYDVIALNGASAALTISGIPFEGPVGAVRIAYSTEGTWIPHPTHEESEESTFEMVVAGRLMDDGDVAVMMVEAGGTEKSFNYYADGAPKVDEAVLADGLTACKVWIQEVIGLQTQLVIAAGVAAPIKWSPIVDYSDDVYARVEAVATTEAAKVMSIADKAERDVAQDALKDSVRDQLGEEFSELADASKQIGNALRSVIKKVVRDRVVAEGVRIDGRGTSDLRPLSSEVAILSTAHGSGLFQRGETQVLNVATLGMLRMEQIVDTLNPSNRKRYMHHYNFPPFSTGEAGFMRGPKRREIGHGALAERALLPVIPSKEDFPYVLRLVSDVLSSNGSTSMASVCSSSLSLMDAGVPIIAPVAGIAMGLIKEGDKYIPLTDILGAEDAMGDMDFKVAGTADAITALQLDTKIDGIPADVLTKALTQAKVARMAILENMTSEISEPRDDVGEAAPKIVSFEIPMDKIGEVIGPRGKVINTIQEETGADIAVDDDGSVGTVSVGSVDRAKVDEAVRQVQLIVNPPTADLGAEYDGRVVNITKFGAFVNILPGTDGLLHISKIGGSRRIDRVEDELSLGDIIKVRVDDIDPNGKLSLTPVDVDGGDDDGGDSNRSSSSSSRDSGSSNRDSGSSNRDSGRGNRDSNRSDSSSDSSDKGSDEGERKQVSFEDSFDSQAREEFGDLGPGEESRGGRGGGGGRGRGGRDGGGRGRGNGRQR